MEISLITIFFTAACAHFLALLSPGPDFLLIVKSAIKNGTKNSVGVAAGIASANAVYIALCLIGVGAILASSLMIMVTLKIAGGLFLTYIAYMALKAKREDYRAIAQTIIDNKNNSSSFFKEFLTGFMSGILNPKNLLFYISLFTVVLTKDVNLFFKIFLGIWMTSVVFLWDVFVIVLLSKNTVRQKFSKVAFYIDKFTGLILGGIGLSIVKSAISNK
jgi:threonine efflux protein